MSRDHGVDGIGHAHQWVSSEPQRRICRNDPVRTKVNDLLATGASYAMVLRALGDDNATLEQRDRVTIDSIRNHCVRHFPVQQVARATYREILERRAKENSVDFIEGVATAVTPVAFLETVIVKGYQTLVDELTTVSSTRSPARTRAPLTAPGCWPNDMRQPPPQRQRERFPKSPKHWIALGWSSCGDSLRSRARCALDRPYIVRSVSTPRGTFMKTSACMLVASVFRVMMSDKVVFFTMRTSAGSSAFSK